MAVLPGSNTWRVRKPSLHTPACQRKRPASIRCSMVCDKNMGVIKFTCVKYMKLIGPHLWTRKPHYSELIVTIYIPAFAGETANFLCLITQNCRSKPHLLPGSSNIYMSARSLHPPSPISSQQRNHLIHLKSENSQMAVKLEDCFLAMDLVSLPLSSLSLSLPLPLSLSLSLSLPPSLSLSLSLFLSLSYMFMYQPKFSAQCGVVFTRLKKN